MCWGLVRRSATKLYILMCWDHALLWLGYMLDDKCGYFEFGTVCLTICAPRLRQVHDGIMTCIISTFHFLFMISSMSMMFIMMAMTMTMICWFKYYACICILALMMIVNEGVHYLGGHIGVSGCRRASTQAIPVYAMKWDDHVDM